MTWRHVHIALFLFMGIVIALVFSNEVSTAWIDPVTGSGKSRTSYFLPGRTSIHRSALEHWIIEHEGGYTPQWQFLGSKSVGLLGVSHACGPEAEIYPMTRIDDIYIRLSSDDEIRKFVEVMRHGSRDQKRETVDHASKVVLDSLAAVKK